MSARLFARPVQRYWPFMRNPRPRSVDLAMTSAEALASARGTMLVRRTSYGQQEDVTQETIEVPRFETPPAYVRVSGGVTRNLGDYNSAKVEVSVQLPCYPEETEIDRAYRYASDLVDNLIRREMALATSPNPVI
jgi:hypothetical protein